MIQKRKDDLDPLDYTDEMPSLMSAWGRVDIHTLVAKFLSDSNVNGPYLEFGVGKGRSAVSAIRAYSRQNVCDQFYLFDSFCGLPALEGHDSSSDQFQKGDFSFSKEQVLAFIKQHDIATESNVHLIEGWIEKTLVNWLKGFSELKAAVVHIDVDLYQSCKDVLDLLKPVLQNGTILLFDDWNCFKASSKHGERRATSEWLEANQAIKLHAYTAYGWHGASFIVEIAEAL